MKRFLQLNHQLGFLIFLWIIAFTLLAEVADKIPYLNSKLPMRSVIITKQDINLYSTEYENGQKNPVGILKSGETVDFEAWVCPYKAIKLSNGERYLILAEERKHEIEIKRLKFYYFNLTLLKTSQ